MSDTAPTREEEMLARLAELDLMAAEKAHAKLMAADDASEIAEMGRTYQRLARSLRQTLAIKARLTREREDAAARRPQPRPEFVDHEGLLIITPAERAVIERAKARIMPYIERERPDWEDGLDEIEVYDVLLTLAEDLDVLDTPIETLVARALHILGLGHPDDDTLPVGEHPDGPPAQSSA